MSEQPWRSTKYDPPKSDGTYLVELFGSPVVAECVYGKWWEYDDRIFPEHWMEIPCLVGDRIKIGGVVKSSWALTAGCEAEVLDGE